MGSSPGHAAGGEAETAPFDHRKGPRRRGDTLHNAIFEATLEELAEVGYAELTMERVAARARASKASLYRRWSSRAELVADAVRHVAPSRDELPDTGDVRTDLLALLRYAASWLSGPAGEAARGLIAEALRDPELTKAVRARFIESGSDFVLDILRRGATRGEVRPGALTPRVAAVGPALLRQHFLIHGAPVPDEVIVEIVDDVLMPLVRSNP
ncbi:MAG: TetR family transcriptional regulator [Streptosporangiales bacterium]|nr:TetR family transcriptional regulator [Streptosporangiales bacterium]